MPNYKLFCENPTRQQDGSWIMSAVVKDLISSTPAIVLARKKVKIQDLSEEEINRGIEEIKNWFSSWSPTEEKTQAAKEKMQAKLDLIGKEK